MVNGKAKTVYPTEKMEKNKKSLKFIYNFIYQCFAGKKIVKEDCPFF